MNRSMQNYSAKMQQLHERLKNLISETEPGDRLPSEPHLAKQFGVSRATLREAMRIFETDGVIHRRQGVGTFVVHPAQVIETGLELLESLPAISRRMGQDIEMGVYQVEHRAATPEELKRFSLDEKARVVEVSWVMEANDRPVAYLVDILPDDLIKPAVIHREFDGSILDLLIRRRNAVSRSRTEISAVAAAPDIARALGIQRRDVLLFFEAQLFNDAGRLLDHSYSYYLPGFFRFHIQRRVG